LCNGQSQTKVSSKHVDRVYSQPGELLFLDIAGIKTPSKGGESFRVRFVDAYSGGVISRFLKYKSEFKKMGMEVFKRLADQGIKILTVRCDNAGENKHLENECMKQQMGIRFEYTAPGTPQQNEVAERKFATLFGRVRAINIAAGFDMKTRTELWAEVANCATDMDNIIVRENGQKTPYDVFYGKPAPFATHLRTFGELGVIRDITSVKAKLEDRGVTRIFIGYAAQHPGNVYRMLNLKNWHLRLSRDIQWLGTRRGNNDAMNREDPFTFPISVGSPLGNGEEERCRNVEADVSKVVTNIDVSKTEEIKTETQTKAGEDGPEEGWHIVNAGREKIHYEARPTGQTRSGTTYKINIATIANATNTLYSLKMMKTLNLLMRHGIMKILIRERAGGKFLKKNLMIWTPDNCFILLT
jgi:hypothetical protein